MNEGFCDITLLIYDSLYVHISRNVISNASELHNKQTLHLSLQVKDKKTSGRENLDSNIWKKILIFYSIMQFKYEEIMKINAIWADFAFHFLSYKITWNLKWT